MIAITRDRSFGRRPDFNQTQSIRFPVQLSPVFDQLRIVGQLVIVPKVEPELFLGWW